MPTILRIALLTGLLALASNLAVIGFVYWQTYDESLGNLRRDTAEQAQSLIDIYRFGGLEAVRDEVSDTARSSQSGDIVALIGPGRTELSGNLSPQAVSSVPARPGTYIIGLQSPGEPRARETVAAVRRLGDSRLVFARPSGGGLMLRQLLERTLLIGAALSLLLGLVAAGLIARFVGARVRDVAAVTQDFARGDFERRAFVGPGSDSFAELAQQINGMLDRITILMGELRMLTDSLAHDLRSPLGRLRSAADAALRTPDSSERDRLLGGIIAEADALVRMLGTVLEIGRSESLSARSQFDWFDPARLMAEVAEMYEPLAEDQGMRLSYDGPATSPALFGHSQLVAQALSNLVENALAYAKSGREVRLTLAEEGGIYRLCVFDRGPGIAPEQEALARRRFGRLDPSRSAGGAGLGLALVEAIAHAHGGELQLRDNAPGLVVELLIPRSLDDKR